MSRRLVLMIWIVVVAVATRLSAHDPLGFDGTVVKMDSAKNVLTMQIVENGQPVTYDLTFDSKMSKTTVTQNGKKVSTSALKPGLHVKVAALGCIDEREIDAVTVQILPPGSGMPPEHAMDMSMPMDMPMPQPGVTVAPAGELGTEIPPGDRIPTVALHADGF